MDVYNYIGPGVDTWRCNSQANRMWIWNVTDGTLRNKFTNTCLTVPLELEIWAGTLTGGSQAVLLFNRGDSNDDQITVQWNDIGFPNGHPASVRDLWARKDLGTFTDNFTSTNLPSHGVMLLNITLIK